MTKKQKSKYVGALLAPPQPSLFDNLGKGDELSNYDKAQRALTNDNL